MSAHCHKSLWVCTITSHYDSPYLNDIRQWVHTVTNKSLWVCTVTSRYDSPYLNDIQQWVHTVTSHCECVLSQVTMTVLISMKFNNECTLWQVIVSVYCHKSLWPSLSQCHLTMAARCHKWLLVCTVTNSYEMTTFDVVRMESSKHS